MLKISKYEARATAGEPRPLTSWGWSCKKYVKDLGATASKIQEPDVLLDLSSYSGDDHPRRKCHILLEYVIAKN